MKLTMLRSSIVALAMLSGSAAMAANAGKRLVTDATEIFYRTLTVPAGNALTLTTTGLSAGSDTVINVQRSDNGVSVAFNDDCVDTDNHSCVSIPAKTTDQTYIVIVRAWNNLTAGVAQLVWSIGSTDGGTTAPFSFGGFAINTGSLPADSMVYTTRIQKQADDTILLAVGPGEMVSGWNDDGGPANMSELRVTSSTAKIIVGLFPDSAAGSTLLYWDEEANRVDTDSDGLGDTLEASVLSTLPGDPDSDGDGIKDGDEVKGIKESGGALAVELPTWGADPNIKDLFIEADWEACPSCMNNIDFFQASGAIAQGIASAFWGPTTGGAQPPTNLRIATHIDIGLTNPALAGDPSLIQWGDWGGAEQVPAGQGCGVDTRAPGRSMFHLTVGAPGTGSTGTNWCSTVALSGTASAHELGHQLSLAHGGSPGAGDVNNKVIYPSLMNYSYQSNPQTPTFSAAPMRGVYFNPSSINETTWLNGNTSANLGVINDPNSLNTPYLLGTDGKSLDWNEDGLLQSVPVSARANPAGTSGRFRDAAFGFPNQRTDPTLAWYVTPAGARLYIAYRGKGTGTSTAGQIFTRYNLDVESACSANFAPPLWPNQAGCSTWSDEVAVPNALFTTTAPALTEFVEGGVRKLMMVYAIDGAQFYYQILTVNSAGTAVWTAPATVPGPLLLTTPTAVYDSTAGRVDVFSSGTSGQVLRWSYNTATSTWDMVAVTQTRQSDNFAFPTIAGPAMTWGFLKGDSTKYLFGAFPQGATQNMLFARRIQGTNQWTFLDLGSVVIYADIRPGLTYTPMPDGGGRFTIITRYQFAGFGYSPSIYFSEGNDPTPSATKQRLTAWQSGLYYYQEDRAGTFNPDGSPADFPAMSLAFDSQRDSSIRGAWSNGNAVIFQPLADGQPNYSAFRDQNDWYTLARNLKCMNDASSCQVCVSVNSDGSCDAWCKGSDLKGDGSCKLPFYSWVVTQNVYDGGQWWGTISVKNNGPAVASGLVVEFDVAPNANCTNDAVPSGATLSPLTGSGTSARTLGNHCVFTWTSGTSLAVNGTKTFNYSTNSQAFTAASNIRTTAATATACAAESNASFCARLGKNCGTVSGLDNCQVNRTVSSCGSCASPATCGGAGTANVCGAATGPCSLSITKNVYDGPAWWGTITFKNNGPGTSTNPKVQFDVPAGVHCTNDAIPPGATLSPLTGSGSSAHTISNHCVFTWTTAPALAPGASRTFNYSTDSQSFTAASNVTATDSLCQ